MPASSLVRANSGLSGPWYAATEAEMLAALRARIGGLTAAEAAERLKAEGPNSLPGESRTRLWRIVAGQFKSVIIWVLIAAGGVSLLLGQTVDAVAILVIVGLNAAIGVYQEFRAEKSLAALKKFSAPTAKVWREGKVVEVRAAEIVAGDVLELAAGDLVVADGRLLAATTLRCFEAVLTGEAEAVTKRVEVLPADKRALGEQSNLVFAGTGVATGTGRAVVYATAGKTELGGIAELIAKMDAEGRTPLQLRLETFGHGLALGALGVVGLMFLLGMWRGTPWLELFMTSISLAVAAVPEGLPAVVTVALSLGVARMARRRALVRKLAAVETLGSTTVICTDKTGTLTVGEMTVRVLQVAGRSYEVTGEGYGPVGEVRAVGGGEWSEGERAGLAELSTVLLGCNQAELVQADGAWQVRGDPTEGALLVAGAKAGGDRARLEREAPKQVAFAFDSDRKRASTVRHWADGRRRVFCNGAPGLLLERCKQVLTAAGVVDLNEAERGQIAAEIAGLAGRGLRVLGSAYGDLAGRDAAEATPEEVERDLVFVGLTGMQDPPRAEVKAAIAQCKSAGIRIVMITGDHPRTALAIAGELGLGPAGGKVIVATGVELDALSEPALRRRVGFIGIYARVTAAHKLRVVRALQAAGEVVAMTGDGVNDAPALKGADIGVAMGKGGTEVTRQAADMVLTDNNFTTIVAAVEEGRGIDDNIRKTLQYLLAGNAGELLLMAGCVVAGWPMALLPIQLLWVNLVTDGLPALCLAADTVSAGVMRRRPRARLQRITDRRFLRAMVLTGVLTAGAAGAVYFWRLQAGSLAEARTAAFTVLVFSELLRSFGARSETVPVWRMKFRANRSLWVVVAGSITVQMVILQSVALGRILQTAPVSWGLSLVYLAVGAVPLLGMEWFKWLQRDKSCGRDDLALIA